jgi:hypothetical protein
MRALSLLCFLLLVAGCGGAPPSGPGAALLGSSWTVERIVYPSGEVIRGGGETIAFGADGSLSLSSCNTCQGRFRTDGQTLTIREPLACTRRACQPGQIELERFVGGVQSVERDGAYLVLRTLPSEDAERPSPEPPSVLLLPQEAPASAR